MITFLSKKIFAKRPPRAARYTIAVTDGVWLPVRSAGGPEPGDLGGNRDEKDHLDDVGVSH